MQFQSFWGINFYYKSCFRIIQVRYFQIYELDFWPSSFRRIRLNPVNMVHRIHPFQGIFIKILLDRY
jgi:hypothetical protein